MPAYEHEPLRDDDTPSDKEFIRVITLLPGKANDRIRIHISREPFNGTACSDYEALSYAWADSTKNLREIEVVSKLRAKASGKALGILRHTGPPHDDAKTFKLRSNLVSIFEHLRRPHTTRMLWVDAICLDQGDKAEKAREIKKMGEIYASARNVVIWLGCGSQQAERGWQFISYLGRQIHWDTKKRQLTHVPGCDQTWKNWDEKAFQVPITPEIWHAIEKVVSCGWFRRVWIWQEICLANHDSALIQYGESVMPWKTFRNAIAFLNGDTESGAPGFKEDFRASLKPVANLALIPQNRHLLGMLGVTRRCGCDKPSDRIYGVSNHSHPFTSL